MAISQRVKEMSGCLPERIFKTSGRAGSQIGTEEIPDGHRAFANAGGKLTPFAGRGSVCDSVFGRTSHTHNSTNRIAFY